MERQGYLPSIVNKWCSSFYSNIKLSYSAASDPKLTWLETKILVGLTLFVHLRRLQNHIRVAEPYSYTGNLAYFQSVME